MAGHARVNLIELVTQVNGEVYTHTPHLGMAEEIREFDRILFDTWDEYRQTRNE